MPLLIWLLLTVFLSWLFIELVINQSAREDKWRQSVIESSGNPYCYICGDKVHEWSLAGCDEDGNLTCTRHGLSNLRPPTPPKETRT